MPERVKLLLQALIQGEMGTRELLDVLGLKHRPTFLYDDLQPALSTGLEEMTQPDSPKSPTQKYRLIDKVRRASV